jgi:hypothetical protein
MKRKYEALILLPLGTSASLDDAEQLITGFIERQDAGKERYDLSRHGSTLYMAVGEWSVAIRFNASPSVIEEARQIGDYYGANRHDKELLATYGSRFEIESVTDDPGMDYFNDYVLILELLSSYPSAKIFDPQAQAFI